MDTPRGLRRRGGASLQPEGRGLPAAGHSDIRSPSRRGGQEHNPHEVLQGMSNEGTQVRQWTDSPPPIQSARTTAGANTQGARDVAVRASGGRTFQEGHLALRALVLKQS